MAWEYVLIDDGNEFEYLGPFPVNTPEEIEDARACMSVSVVPEAEILSLPQEPPSNDAEHFAGSSPTGKKLTRDGIVSG